MTLDKWVRSQPRGALADLARACGVAWGTLHRIRTGESVPGLELAFAIERCTGGAVRAVDLAHEAVRAQQMERMRTSRITTKRRAVARSRGGEA
jgi:DNA-binding XRE family transcriptional regulator